MEQLKGKHFAAVSRREGSLLHIN